MFLPYEIRTIFSEIKEKGIGIIATLFLLLLYTIGNAQEGPLVKETSNPHYQRYRLQGSMQARTNLKPKAAFTSVAFSLPAKTDFADLRVVANMDTFLVKPAPHQPEGKVGLMSNLLVFSGPQEELQLIETLPAKEAVIVHFFYAAPLKEGSGGESQRQRYLASPCDEPVAVQQSVWRKGLPEPDYSRSFNEVEHLIVHHSASGNNTTNYTEEVRNYYLYHTQGNGWSDIGYNYLIAPDGTLYAGRDPGAGEQDNVAGAHFCGQNRQTMGVCLIGDYTNREPSTAAMLQLEHLLSWKSFKEKLDPLASSPHPANPDLGVIAGHRNGCATACPGDQVYQQLPELRLAVSANVKACEEGPAATDVWVYFASRQQEVCLTGIEKREVESFSVYNIQGKRVFNVAFPQLENDDFCVKMGGMAAGIYFVQAKHGNAFIRKKILLF